MNFCGAAFLTDQVSFERATEWIQIACEEDLSESTLSVDWLEIFRIINTILRSSERDGHEVTEEVLPVTGAAVNLIQEEGVEPIGARPLLVANGVYRHPNDEEKFAALRELVQESLEASEKASRRAEAAEARSLKAEEAAKEDRQKATVAIAEARHATARAEEAIQSSQARMRFVLADEDDPQPQQLDEQTGDEDLTPDEIIRRLKLTGYKVTAKSTRQHGKLKAS